MTKLYSAVLLVISACNGAWAMNLADKSKSFFNSLNINTIETVKDFYADKIQFVDPVHSIDGVENLKAYYAGLYKNAKSIRFEFTTAIEQQNEVALFWTMNLEAPALDKNLIQVSGSSLIRFDPVSQKAVFHRDVFDMGEFVYERVPLFGFFTRKIKAYFGSTK